MENKIEYEIYRYIYKYKNVSRLIFIKDFWYEISWKKERQLPN